ncbi:hypothetical protein [Streptomyces dysideae]|uniref:Membrane-bound hydrophilic protein n=1 Tax=Streptomyces dysideae TaxID=909626 RepID=A0A117RYS7_9ACTN|nr:hypothetical protein [Streptomyces dysideae]KUO16637.1 hypothetical protein AQJ91_34445 [Streptomyces dysideae]
MSADETHGEGPEVSTRVRSGPRHAAPKKPLFTRFNMPAGKAIAMAAMPTAVLMGIGFTPTLALADEQPTSKSLTADEYKDCLAALDEDGAAPSPTPSPSASSDDDAATDEDKDEPAETPPSAPASPDAGDSSSSDSGSDDEADPTPSPSASPSKESNSTSGDTATASPSPSDSGGNLLEDIGDAITGIFTGGSDSESGSDSASGGESPTPSPSASAPEDTAKDTSDAAEETTEKVTDTVDGTVKDTTDAASKVAEDTTKAVAEETAEAAAGTPTPSPSASPTTAAEDCPVATDAEGDVDNKVLVADNPWYLEASSLLLKGADYQGVVEVKTAGGKTKKVLKYVISDGTDIGDLHQLVKEHDKTYHVQAAKGSTSTIRDGDTVMYTESISGNLFGLLPITFNPEHPPPLNIPLIYFTNVKITQAAQFGGTLHVPGMQQYTTN